VDSRDTKNVIGKFDTPDILSKRVRINTIKNNIITYFAVICKKNIRKLVNNLNLSLKKLKINIMKKYILLLGFMFSVASFSQNITSKSENANVAQYELLKKVNEYYPDISLSEKVVNFYIDDKIIDTKQEFALKGTEFTSYKLSINPDNKRVIFDFVSDKNGKIYGAVIVFKRNYVRTTFNENLGQVDIMVNGKSVCMQKM
jgi:hypothetical protein